MRLANLRSRIPKSPRHTLGGLDPISPTAMHQTLREYERQGSSPGVLELTVLCREALCSLHAPGLGGTAQYDSKAEGYDGNVVGNIDRM